MVVDKRRSNWDRCTKFCTNAILRVETVLTFLSCSLPFLFSLFLLPWRSSVVLEGWTGKVGGRWKVDGSNVDMDSGPHNIQSESMGSGKRRRRRRRIMISI